MPCRNGSSNRRARGAALPRASRRTIPGSLYDRPGCWWRVLINSMPPSKASYGVLLVFGMEGCFFTPPSVAKRLDRFEGGRSLTLSDRRRYRAILASSSIHFSHIRRSMARQVSIWLLRRLVWQERPLGRMRLSSREWLHRSHLSGLCWGELAKLINGPCRRTSKTDASAHHRGC